MPYLDWIADENLENEVLKILETASVGLTRAEEEFDKNVIDPFSILFEMAGFGIETVEQWIISERSRKAQKTLSGAFGTFHQSILGQVDGWQDLGIGHSADLFCESKLIVAEVKNKFNTVKGSDQVTVYDHLESLVMPKASIYKGFTAYYVEIIPKPLSGKPRKYDVPFRPSDKETKTLRPENPQIRKIDGKSFYALVTNDENALQDLYNVLPFVIGNLTGNFIKKDQLDLMGGYFSKAIQVDAD